MGLKNVIYVFVLLIAAAAAQTVLFDAAASGDVEVVATEITDGRGWQVGKAYTDGKTPLMVAAQNGHLAVVTALLESGEDSLIDKKANGQIGNALYAASKNGHRDIVSALLAAGATPNLGVGTSSPLTIAAFNGHFDIAMQLIDGGANPNAGREVLSNDNIPLYARKEPSQIVTGEAGFLFMAVEASHLEAVTKYMDLRTDTNKDIQTLEVTDGSATVDDASQLTKAFDQGDAEIAKVLMAGGFPLLLGHTLDGKMPVSAAVSTLDISVVDTFLTALADSNRRIDLHQSQDILAEKEQHIIAYAIELGSWDLALHILDFLENDLSTDDYFGYDESPGRSSLNYGGVTVDGKLDTIVHAACLTFNATIIEAFFSLNAPTSADGETPLASSDFASINQHIQGSDDWDLCTHTFARAGRADLLQLILDSTALYRDETGNTYGGHSFALKNSAGELPLQLATMGGHADAVRVILSNVDHNQVSLHQRDDSGKLGLNEAIKAGNVAVLQAYADAMNVATHTHSCNQKDGDGETALRLAVKAGSSGLGASLVALCMNQDITGVGGSGNPLDTAGNQNSTLTLAVATNNVPTVTALLEWFVRKGKDYAPVKQDNDAISPGELAAMKGYDEVIDAFFAPGVPRTLLCTANEIQRAVSCDTVMRAAVENNHPAAVASLIAGGIVHYTSYTDSKWPLYIAAENGFAGVAGVLANAVGTHLDKATPLGKTALMAAAEFGDAATVRAICTADGGGSGGKLAATDFQKYPGYAGTLVVGGTVGPMTTSGTAQTFKYSLTGTDPACSSGAGTAANSCGVHIHSGTTCSAAANVGGHFFTGTVTEDPWETIAYTSDSTGAASGSAVAVNTGATAAEAAGRAMVIHDYTGARIACTPLAASGGRPVSVNQALTSGAVPDRATAVSFAVSEGNDAAAEVLVCECGAAPKGNDILCLK